MSPSCPYHSVAVLATTMLWASIILPITPPQLFAAAINVGDSPTCVAEIFCKLPESTLEAVSDPVSATPSRPRSVTTDGLNTPVRANAKTIVASTPDSRVNKATRIIAAYVLYQDST